MTLAVNARSEAGSQDEASCVPPRVIRSKSVIPPAVVERSTNKVVLSWRATLGQCSIRMEAPEGIENGKEWVNLEEDARQEALQRRRDAKCGVQSLPRAPVVDVYEVDDVQLQTCGGCPLCIHGQEENGEDTDEVGIREHHHHGPACWRAVYQGPDCRCQVDLGPGNALHYFRLLIRARLPPPSRRGFMRPKHTVLRDIDSSTLELSGKARKARGSRRSERTPSSIRSSSPPRWRHEGPGVVVDSGSNPDEVVHLASMSGHCRIDGGDEVSPGKEEGADDRVYWFASEPVFVDSRPPPVTLQGIGTALVVTWPALNGLCGAEQLSYMLEQWSHADVPREPSRSGAVKNAAMANGRTVGRESNERKSAEPCGRPGRRPWHHHHHSMPSRRVDTKDVFSVGTRCWFVPTGLETGRRYWYRLRLIHAEGKSVGGPWSSHLASVAPPLCIRNCSRGLVLSLPGPVGLVEEARGDATGKRIHSECRDDDGERLICRQGSVKIGDDTELLTAERLESQGGGSTAVRADGNASEPLEAGEVGGVNIRGQNNRNDKHEAPIVWYTLEGFTRWSGWIVLYRGPATKVIIEGLPPNTHVKFRAGIDVDFTELRRRSLGLLASLDLETRSPGRGNTANSTSATPRGGTASAVVISGDGPLSQKWLLSRSVSPPKALVARPALRLCSATTGSCSAPIRSVGLGGNTTRTGQAKQRGRSWSPATSPAMTDMRREGFAVHDSSATVGGGYYLERPLLPWGLWVQGRCKGAASERSAGRGSGDGGRPRCREYSAVGEFLSASAPPRFAAFVVGGVPKVKLWWAHPRPGPDIFLTAPRKRPVSAPPSCPDSDAQVGNSRNHHHSAPGRFLESAASPVQRRPSTATAAVAERRPVLVAEDCSIPPPDPHKSHVAFAVDLLHSAAAAEGGPTERSIYSGLGLWTDLGSSPSSSSRRVSAFSALASSTAYSVRLSTKTMVAQPENTVEAVVITAPPAPAMEPIAAAEKKSLPGADAGELVGSVVLKATWDTGIDTSLLPAGRRLPPVSLALEMAHAWEAGPSTEGTGGTSTKISHTMALWRQSQPALQSPRSMEARATAASSLLSQCAARAPDVVREIPVRKDAGLGQCWSLCASSWGKPKMREEGFRVVWTGAESSAEGGTVEALTPALPPGMRFAFRVRMECCFGVAVSAATVYQTALVVPLAPKGLRARLATHESRAGKSSKCVQLLWDPLPLGHGKNVVTSFTVQARRPESPSGGGGERNAGGKKLRGSNFWQRVCSTPEIGCLDPSTLGMAHIYKEFRVRAEGPGGRGPWSDSLRVKFLVPEASDGSNSPGAVTGGVAGGSISSGSFSGYCSSATLADKEAKDPTSGRQPMGCFRPGTRVRDLLTGDARHPRRKQWRVWVLPSPAAMMTPVLPGAVVTASKIASAEQRHRRAGGTKRLLWGQMRSPRVTRGCCIAEMLTTVAAVQGGIAVPRVSGGSRDGTSSDCSRNLQKQSQVTTLDKPEESPGEDGGYSETTPAVPHDLAVILREELDISFRLECRAASGMESGGWGGKADGPDRRDTECPVVSWISSSPDLGVQSRQKQQRHRQHLHQQQQRRRWQRRRRTVDGTPAAAGRGATSSCAGLDEFGFQAQASQKHEQAAAANRERGPLPG